MRNYTLQILVAGLLIGYIGLAQERLPEQNTLTLEPGERSPKATVEEVTWISGHWRGSALGGVAEEVWSKPAGGAMMGMFRLIKDPQVAFYELLTISEEDGSLILRLKHFHNDLRGWEEKDEAVSFRLVRLGTQEAYFDGMTFRKQGDGELQVFVGQRAKDGSRSELVFQYHRVE